MVPNSYSMSQIAPLIAKHLREIYFGGNWTVASFREHLSDVTWRQATTSSHSCNTIAALVFHTNYYLHAALSVLRNETFDYHDKYSFAVPPIESEADWQKLLNTTWQCAEDLATFIEKLPDEQLKKAFRDEKYGNYYRNLHGIIEHAHYHLGQIVLLKKIISQQNPLLS